MDSLIGTTVRRVFISDESDSIVFDTDKGILSYDTYGDCCSITWIESVEGIENLIGQEILNVEEIDISDRCDPEPEKHDVLEIYGYKIITGKGSAIIDFRNDSNGYYGGRLDKTERFVDLSKLKEIKF